MNEIQDQSLKWKFEFTGSNNSSWIYFNKVLNKKITGPNKVLLVWDFNKHVHDIDIFINDKWRKYAGDDIGRLFKITRRLELRFWPTRKRSWSQPSQGDFFTLQCEPWSQVGGPVLIVRTASFTT